MNDAKRVAAAMATQEGSQKLKTLFDAMDADGDGKVTQTEWAAGIAENQELCAELFGSMRSEGDLLQVFDHLSPVKQTEGITWEGFQENTGGLRLVLTMGDSLRSEDGGKELRSLYEALDSNADGAVTIEEWIAGVERIREQPQPWIGPLTNKAEIAAAFKRLDADSDGLLTWEEFTGGAERYREAAAEQVSLG